MDEEPRIVGTVSTLRRVKLQALCPADRPKRRVQFTYPDFRIPGAIAERKKCFAGKLNDRRIEPQTRNFRPAISTVENPQAIRKTIIDAARIALNARAYYTVSSLALKPRTNRVGRLRGVNFAAAKDARKRNAETVVIAGHTAGRDALPVLTVCLACFLKQAIAGTFKALPRMIVFHVAPQVIDKVTPPGRPLQMIEGKEQSADVAG
jgi:hypothetical protein